MYEKSSAYEYVLACLGTERGAAAARGIEPRGFALQRPSRTVVDELNTPIAIRRRQQIPAEVNATASLCRQRGAASAAGCARSVSVALSCLSAHRNGSADGSTNARFASWRLAAT